MRMSQLPVELNFINFETHLNEGQDGHPVEVSVVLSNGQCYRRLIKPAEGWAGWCENTELQFGISRWELERYGKFPDQVCNELNILCADKNIYSDHWSADSPVLENLFRSAHVPCEIMLSPIELLLESSSREEWLSWKRFITDVLYIDEKNIHGIEKTKLTQTAIALLIAESENDLNKEKTAGKKSAKAA